MAETTRPTEGTLSIWRAATAEFIATFVLVFIGAGAVVASNLGLDLVGVGLATGFAVGAMVWVIRHLSGGHMNPAVTIGLWSAGEISPARALAYVAAQLLGAIAGGLLLRYLVPGALYTAAAGGVPSLEATMGTGKGIVIEAMITFVLVFVFFGALVDPRGGSSRGAGVPLGLTVAFGIMAFAPYTGAAMNPARWLGPAFAARQWDDWPVWLAGPLLGGVIAAMVYRSIFLGDREQGSQRQRADD